MLSLGLRTAKQTDTKHSDECVLLIDAEADDAARILDELSSATDERFDVEWVPDLSEESSGCVTAELGQSCLT